MAAEKQSRTRQETKPVIPRWALYGTACVTGAAVMVVEILGTRVLAPVFGASLFVWAALLAVTLLALAIGYYAGGALVDRRPVPRVLGVTCVVAAVALGVTVPVSRPALAAGLAWGPRLGPLACASLLFGPTLIALGMISPVAVRLATTDVSGTGHKVGGVYAISTAGSLLGTLLAAFYFIPTFATNEIVLGTAALVGLTGALWLPARGRVAALLLAVTIPAWSSAAPARTLPAGLRVVERVQSPYGLLEVIDDTNRDVRLMRADHSIIAAQFLDDQTAAFAFLHVLEAVRFLRPQAKDMLQLGLGGGTLVHALQPHRIAADVIEIDPGVVHLATAHFGYLTTGTTYTEDARAFLNRTDRKYDLVVHDTFTGGATPEHLLSLEVMREIQRHLRPGGVLAMAFPGFDHGLGAQASRAVARTLQTVFSNVRIFRDAPPRSGPPEVVNLIYFASDGALDIYVPDDAVFETPACKHTLTSFQAWETLKEVPPGELITDAYNPLARLQLPVAEAHFEAMGKLLPEEVWLP